MPADKKRFWRYVIGYGAFFLLGCLGIGKLVDAWTDGLATPVVGFLTSAVWGLAVGGLAQAMWKAWDVVNRWDRSVPEEYR